MVEHRVTSNDINGVSLIGFRIDPDSESPDIYTLMTYGAREVPIVVDGKILFFTSVSSVKVAYDFFSEDVKSVASVPSGTDAICDVAKALHIINHQDLTESLSSSITIQHLAIDNYRPDTPQNCIRNLCSFQIQPGHVFSKILIKG